MSKVITQRERRNQSGDVMRALDRGETFIIARNGVPVGELRAVKQQFAARDSVIAALKGAPAIDARRFRLDVDTGVDQDSEPRA